MQLERRYVQAELRAERADDGTPKRIRGYAAVFGQKSVNLGGFVEIIAPGAFDRAIREKDDVRALIEHDPRAGLLGRTSSGTLRLSTDKRGLKAEIDVPTTRAAEDLLVSIERGDLDGMSFAFRLAPEGDEWEDGEDGGAIRTINEVAELVDVSVVSYPAYPQTQVSARALERAQEMIRQHPPGPPINLLRLRHRADGADIALGPERAR